MMVPGPPLKCGVGPEQGGSTPEAVLQVEAQLSTGSAMPPTLQ